MNRSDSQTLAARAAELKDWLVHVALPVWWQNGVDRNGWGFHESLAADYSPSRADRRCRVQLRQSYAFSVGAALGWPGDAAHAAEIGLKAIRNRFLRSDGLFRTLVSHGGDIVDDTPKIYDHAFVLLALASVQPLRPRSEAEATDLLDRLMKLAFHPAGGFVESGGRYLSNPQMHLFEAALAWTGAGQSPVWRNLAAEIAELALTRLFDPDKGFVRECYDADWAPAAGAEGRRLEPGHQFEWAWLMQRWALISGDARASAAALRLHRAGKRGLSHDQTAVIDEMGDDFRPLTATARLWPQTEWLKSAALQALIAKDRPSQDAYVAETLAAHAALVRYFDVAKPGLWRDKRQADGGFADELVPASSLYHIVSAVEQLAELAEGLGWGTGDALLRTA